MRLTSISEDFITYLAANWASVTGNTVPSIMKVMNFDRNRRIQGFKGTVTNGVVLVHRGSIQMIPLDFGYASQAWSTAIMLHGANSTQVQQLTLDILSLINNWEAAGGGTFAVYDSGSAGVTTVSTGTFTESGQNFETTVNIGDRLNITSGNDIGTYTINTVVDDTELTCNATFIGSTGAAWNITSGLKMTSFETGVFDITMEKTAVGNITFYSKQYARS